MDASQDPATRDGSPTAGRMWFASALLVFVLWGYVDLLAAATFGTLPLGLLGALFTMYLGPGIALGIAGAIFARLLAVAGRAAAPADVTRLFAALVVILTLNAWNYDQTFLPGMVLKGASLAVCLAALAVTLLRSPRSTGALRDARVLSGTMAMLATLLLLRHGLRSSFSAHGDKVATAVFIAFVVVGALVLAVLTRRLGTGTGRALAMVVAAGLLLAGARGIGARVWSNTVLRQAPQADPPTATHANVVLIVIDTVRHDVVGSYGAPDDPTPHLDRLAADAQIMDSAWSTSSWTLPGHASLFTSTYPYRHGAHNVSQSQEVTDDPLSLPAPDLLQARITSISARSMDETLPTLPEILSEAGYRTGAIIGNYGYLARYWGFARGFDDYDDRLRIRLTPFPSFVQFALRKWLRGNGEGFLHRDYRPAETIVDEAVRWIDGGGDERPFFLFMNLMDVHGPYFPHDAAGRSLSRKAVDPPQHEVVKSGRSLTEQEHAVLHGLYVGEMRYVDRQLGQLFEALRTRGLYDDAMVVVTSDHGESFGEHPGVIGHEVSLYEAETRVPLIVKYPASRHAGRSTAWASIIDVMPTILAVAELDGSDSAQGADLRHLDDHRMLLAELYRSDRHAENYGTAFARDLRALLFEDGHEKVIVSTDGTAELYALDDDPGEAHDRALARPERVAQSAEIARTFEALSSEVRSAEAPASEEVRERLRSLGYVD